MRLMKRNKQKIWVADYIDTIPSIDQNGDYIGEEEVKYSAPYSINAVVSGNISFQYQEYGIHDVGSKVIIVEPKDGSKITESSKIWIGSEPPASANYTVEQLDNSLNHIMIMCSRIGGKRNESK